MTLRWHKFASLTGARAAFRDTPCIYVQSDAEGRPVRIGKTEPGLRKRYWGGTGYAIDAAMHGSGNSVFVAEVRRDLASAVEAMLIWEHREMLLYNNVGKRRAPSAITIIHTGDVPEFDQAATAAPDPPQLLVLMKPPKPVNEMTDAERSAFAATCVDAMYREHDRALGDEPD